MSFLRSGICNADASMAGMNLVFTQGLTRWNPLYVNARSGERQVSGSRLIIRRFEKEPVPQVEAEAE